MKLTLSFDLSFDHGHQTPIEHRFLVSIDENRMAWRDGETAADIVLEAMSGTPYRTEVQYFMSRLKQVRKSGIAHFCGTLMPGALDFSWLHPGFPTPELPGIHIDIAKRRLNAPGGESLDLDREFATAIERQDDGSDQKKMLTWDALYDRETIPEHMIRLVERCASVTAGIYDALLPCSASALHQSVGGLVGILLGASGIAGQEGPSPAPRMAHSQMKMTTSLFRRRGYVISDRGWTPRRLLKGPAFDGLLGRLSPRLVDLGRQIAGPVAGLSRQDADTLTCQVIQDIGEDKTQFFDLRPVREPSAHQRVAHARVLAELKRAIEQVAREK